MSSQSRKSASWFARLGKVFQSDRSAARRKQSPRKLRLESLETRSMLSATVLPSIAGVVYQDLVVVALTVAGKVQAAEVDPCPLGLQPDRNLVAGEAGTECH